MVAIIGVLASVVLASLNSARSKGNAAAIKSNLKNMGAQAELAYSDAGDYSTVCAGVAKMLAAITNAGASSACLSSNNSGFFDVYQRWGATGIKYSTTPPVQAWSSDPTGAVTWDAQGVNSSGTFVDTDETMTWPTANTACATAGGRLPSMEELKTLSDATHTASGSTYTPPGFVASGYWSNTLVSFYSYPRAYAVNMATGSVYTTTATTTLTYTAYVRCVR